MKHNWSRKEQSILKRLSSPGAIQDYLINLNYSGDPITQSPRFVMKFGKAHCFDGALFAAAALEFNGEAPLIVDMRANQNDDDHVIAVYKRNHLWGAIAKSNYVTCRYRDPVYSSIRELVMSYFEGYFNLRGEKTLREYSIPFDLRNVRTIDWRFSAQDLNILGERLDAYRHYRLIPKRQERFLLPPDRLSFRAATLGIDRKKAFKV